MEQDRGIWTSASSAEYDRACPGRFRAQRGLAELPKTEESQAGERIHAIWAGESVANPSTADMDAADLLFEQENELSKNYFGEKEAGETVRMTEQRLWHEFRPSYAGFHEANGPVKTSGRFDVVRLHTPSRKALLLDGKTGWLEVTQSPSNLQLRRLAALLYLAIGPIEIGVAILGRFGKPQLCIYSHQDLERSVVEMEQDVSRSHDPKSPRVAGEAQCKYCRAASTCPTHQAWLGVALPAVVEAPALPMVSAREWTPAQRVIFLEREKQARDWLEERKEELKTLLAEDANAVPGYRLREGRTTETVTDAQEVFKRFTANVGGTVEQFMPCVKLGKTAFKDAVREATGHKGKMLEADVDALLVGCTEAKPSAPTIERVK